MIVAETERLRIRHLTLEDAPFILGHLNEPSFIENIRDSGVRTLADAEKYLKDGPLASYATHGFGLFLVELLKTGEPIGMCGLLQRDYLDHPDIGFALDPPFWGKGYARESAEAVLAYGFGDLGMRCILAITSPANERSAGLLTRLGMLDEGTLQQQEQYVRQFRLSAPVTE